jgi:hypothetical protein
MTEEVVVTEEAALVVVADAVVVVETGDINKIKITWHPVTGFNHGDIFKFIKDVTTKKIETPERTEGAYT